jgi:hypothetical protein
LLCLVHHHVSWHPFHHVKHHIIYICVVHTRVRRFVLNECWRGWCWSIFRKVSFTHGVREGHPSTVLVSSIYGVGAKSNFCGLSVELTSLQRRQAPDIPPLFCFINALLHLKSSVMCIMLIGVGWYCCCIITLISIYI